MPAQLEPVRRVKCTYKDCMMSFDTEKQMKSHKKHSDEHEYCPKCDVDFDSFEDYTMHKIIRPKEHNLACRVCGDEFKSQSGLNRHIDTRHKVAQKLTCIGCHKHYSSASLFIEHLEYGHCEVISPSQFQGHIVHKHLITDLLKSNAALERFKQKTSRSHAAVVDDDVEGGVRLDDPLGDRAEMESIEYEAIRPDTPPEIPPTEASFGPYPPLPSQYAKAKSGGGSEATLSLGNLSITDKDDTQSEAATVKGSMSLVSTATPSTHPSKAWSGRKGKSSAVILFPNAKATAPPKEFSLAAHDQVMEQGHGINIMRTRFWDPMGPDWNPDKFYDALLGKFYCPFICEQTFDCAGDQVKHILGFHRNPRMYCPRCHKHFNSATALIAHCQAVGGRCQVNEADDYNIFLDRLSGGFLSVKEKVRPDHLDDKSVALRNEKTGQTAVYKPPVVTFLEYSVTTPPDWKGPPSKTLQIGGAPESSSTW
ncbi:uncharacterized protein yc1106_05679 [Curvularia clavata]|uniref:C2H2-type domain-containing protein n=1 Tax=Curvularia clavata TaxID=95742 RepID=A0A9Q8ZA05_CURCL|nr:uncharacterized protein yc1106_05679 [Curvularia clavata]